MFVCLYVLARWLDLPHLDNLVGTKLSRYEMEFYADMLYDYHGQRRLESQHLKNEPRLPTYCYDLIGLLNKSLIQLLILLFYISYVVIKPEKRTLRNISTPSSSSLTNNLLLPLISADVTKL